MGGPEYITEFINPQGNEGKDHPMYLCSLEGCKAAWGTSFQMFHHVLKVNHQRNFLKSVYPEDPKIETLRKPDVLLKAMQWEEQKFPNGEKDYSSIVQVIDHDQYMAMRDRRFWHPAEENKDARLSQEKHNYARLPQEENKDARLPQEEHNYARLPQEEHNYARLPQEENKYARLLLETDCRIPHEEVQEGKDCLKQMPAEENKDKDARLLLEEDASISHEEVQGENRMKQEENKDARLLLETEGRMPRKDSDCLKQVPEGGICNAGDKGEILTEGGIANDTRSHEDEALSLEEKMAP